jgi:hypothetical protein
MAARMKVIHDSVQKQVEKWDEIETYYPSQADRSRATRRSSTRSSWSPGTPYGRSPR